MSVKNYKKFCKLKKQIATNKIDGEDIDNINGIMDKERGSLS